MQTQLVISNSTQKALHHAHLPVIGLTAEATQLQFRCLFTISLF